MRGRKFHVAIVDDDKSVRKALARLLSAHSLKTETYNSAETFLASLRAHSPDCIVLDFHMPNGTGLELQQHLSRKGITIPTIVITAHNEIGLRERCEAAGAIAFLAKPLKELALIDAISKVTRQAKNGKSIPP